jgi:hypothetical protein
MAATNYLFDLEPYTDKRLQRRKRRRATSLSPQVRAALARLGRAIDAIPKEEWAERRQRWNELARAINENSN